MATGSPGPNGVYQYGEDDSEATFSALLNKAAGTTDTQIGLDRARLTALEAKPNSGLVPVSPSSVQRTGGSSSGTTTITFSGATSLSLNGVFSSTYKKYRLVLNLTNVAGSTSLQFRYRTSGTDKTTSTYYMIGSYTRQGASPAPYNNTGDRGYFSELLAQSNGIAIADFTNPQVSQRTDCLFVANGNIVQFAHFTGSILEDSTQSFDGITIYTSTAISGSVTVYGYNEG